MSGPDGQWPREQFVDPLTGEPIPSPFGPDGHPTGVPVRTPGTPPTADRAPADPESAPHDVRPDPFEPFFGDDPDTAPPADAVPSDAVPSDAPEPVAAEAETTQPSLETVAARDDEPSTESSPVVWPEFPPGAREPGVLRRTVFPISVTVGALLLITVFVLVGTSGPAHRPGDSAQPPYPGYPTFPSLPPLTLPPTKPPVPIPPSVPGWQGVAVDKYHVAYDVPPDWKVETPTTLVGHEDPTGKPLVVMSGVSTYKDGFCAGHPYSYRAHLGFSRTDLSDPAQAARNAVQSWADAGYSDQLTGGSALITMGTPTTVPVDGGKSTAIQVTGLVAVPSPRECDAPNVLLNAVAVTSPDGLLVCMTEADQDVPDALTPAALSKVVGTIRPLHR